MNSNFYISIILIIGIVQGVFLSIVLLTLKRGNKRANKILGMLILLFTLMILPHAKIETSIRSGSLYDGYIIHMMFFLLPPLLYYYVKSLTGSLPKIKAGDMVHSIPFIIFLLLLIPLLLLQVNEKTWHRLSPVITTLIVIQMTIYLYYSIKLLQNHQQNIRQSFSYLDKINLNWLRFLLYGQIIIWPLFLIAEFTGFQPRNYIWIFPAIFIYLMGYYSIKQPEILVGVLQDKDDKLNGINKKYAKSALTPQMSDYCYTRLIKLMEEKKPYLQNNLTIQSLAQLLSVSNHHLSQVINEKLHQNFYEFINGYRIAEAKKLLTDPGKEHLSIAAIGFEAGFNSVSSFNTVFKKIMNMTPSEFKNSHPPVL